LIKGLAENGSKVRPSPNGSLVLAIDCSPLVPRSVPDRPAFHLQPFAQVAGNMERQTRGTGQLSPILVATLELEVHAVAPPGDLRRYRRHGAERNTGDRRSADVVQLFGRTHQNLPRHALAQLLRGQWREYADVEHGFCEQPAILYLRRQDAIGEAAQRDLEKRTRRHRVRHLSLPFARRKPIEAVLADSTARSFSDSPEPHKYRPHDPAPRMRDFLYSSGNLRVDITKGHLNRGGRVTSTNFAVLLGALIATLGACSTQVQMQVPQSGIKEFAGCMEDPPSSYVRHSAEGKSLDTLGVAPDSVRGLAAGGGHLFVTNDTVTSGLIRAPANEKWAQDVANDFHSLPAELVAASDEVEAIWNHSIHQSFLKAYNELSKTSGDVQRPAAIKVSELQDYMERVRSVTEKNAWYAFAARSAYEIESLRQMEVKDGGEAGRLTISKSLAAQKLIGAVYVSAYLDAYFRNGEFWQLKWNLGNPLQDLETIAHQSTTADQQRIQKILDAIKKADPSAASTIDEVINKNLSGTIGKIASTGLITRGGDSLAMPAISISIDVRPHPATFSKVDSNAILEDVVRVTFEALFDAMNEVPAVSKATGVTGLAPEYAAFALPDFAKVTSRYRPGKLVMDANEFGAVDSDGAKAHALTSSASASLIRGISLAALNNEAVANTITTIAGTTARKVTERAAWCYYAVVGPAASGSASATYARPLSDRKVTFDLSY